MNVSFIRSIMLNVVICVKFPAIRTTKHSMEVNTVYPGIPHTRRQEKKRQPLGATPAILY